MAKKPTLPPEVLNRLTRASEPMMADLQGPGPFQLPPLTKVEGTATAPQGHVAIALETRTAQEVRIVLTEEAASTLRDLLATYFAIQARDAPDRKN